MRVCIFIGGKQIGVNSLRYLLKRGIKPALVIGNEDDDGKDKSWHESLIRVAKENKLDTIAGKKVRELFIVKKIQEINPDVIFCIGGTQLIPKEVLNSTKYGCLNIHPALLPKYRGRYSTVQAIFNGDTKTGVSAHWMDEGMDSGPLILQKEMEIDENDTAKTLYNKFTEVGSEMFEEIADKWIKGEKIPSRPQDESKATYIKKAMPNNGEIDWNWPGIKIRNFIRAMTFEPFPPASFKLGDKEMVIVDKKYFKGFPKDEKY